MRQLTHILREVEAKNEEAEAQLKMQIEARRNDALHHAAEPPGWCR